MKDQALTQALLDQYREEADKLGLTLQEYLLFLVLEKLDNLSVTAYPAED